MLGITTTIRETFLIKIFIQIAPLETIPEPHFNGIKGFHTLMHTHIPLQHQSQIQN